MTPGQWREGGHSFEHRGYSIFYRDDPAGKGGTGEALLCVHGYPTSSWDWARIWTGLRARFRTVAADMIGFGYSAKPARYPYTLLDQADLQVALVKRLGLAVVHILAHDYGVSVGQELLARQHEGELPFRIASMCFLNGGLFPEAHRARPAQKLLASPLGFLLGPIMTRRGRRLFGSNFSQIFGPDHQPTEAELDDLWSLVAREGGARIQGRLLRYMNERKVRRERWVGALRETSVPLRLVNGPEDPVSGRHMAERYRELVPGPDIVLLDGCGHYPQLEDPAAVLRAYLEFAAAVAAGRGPTTAE